MGINNVIICGLGSLGLTYANELKDFCNLKILVDERRKQNFLKNKPSLNGKDVELDYILPNEDFDADLIIISTKSSGLDSAIEYIRNFVSEKTIILSLVNGISSEDKIANVFGKDTVLHSYYIGKSAMSKKVDGKIVAECDGCGKIVFGTPYFENTKKVEDLKKFFNQTNLEYEIPDDILYSIWVKFGVNVCLNQLSAIYRLTVGELKRISEYSEYSEKLVDEVLSIAYAYGVKNLENFKKEVFENINLVNSVGKTSMLQDILSKRQTEVDIFGGKIIELGKKYGIETPYNKMMYNRIKEIEGSY